MQGKKIILGICGSIAAYKSPLLLRLLTGAGAEVQVVATEAALSFVAPATLSALSGKPVLSEFYNAEGLWNNHVDLGLWADALVIAPASAGTMAKAANGLCDNLLLSVYLSARCPVVWAPAMDLDMYAHPSTTANIAQLKSYGNLFLAPSDGPLASGLSGKGRMQEPAEIFEALQALLSSSQDLQGLKVLLTSGPTHEPLDPVRFLANKSTGTMGNAIALELAGRGAKVRLISGPVHQLPIHPNIEITRVDTAVQMRDAAVHYFPASNWAIMAAAVADYTPEKVSDVKIKKNGDEGLIVTLVKNPDIAKELGRMKNNKQLLAGFALETNDEEFNALKKLESKNLDVIFLNSLQEPGAGFGTGTNKVTAYDRKNNVLPFDLKPKPEVAKDIVNTLIAYSNSSPSV